ncbi:MULTISPECIES: coniferyl-alcohol dehydrogenase [Gammaproteobacteria]|uniref:3-alpha-hydroxysteroid dehydrogenase n=1 Tax=Pseudomonas lini TaxID=163011 RepID=A0A423IIN6_9PSED|nr:MULTISPECIES: coniferyl-alcohol dehydrogenase [Gammaproteobacteria]MBK5304030.1 coniferyl-alcohol dehydrogenase [Bacillus sp. TH86]MBK5323799.1 coniferyl-alcohol dehydrogenase [Bacillus sp. TH59]MBK5338749.1 coniferyl-alcohol dehydrogenase [Bacillus sp. TH57]MBK5312802.1 coniferyl-alcohol dehydrogenase [Pseudomonas sp. TH71]MBK5318297.1 coniferyl-alcohol dehydrogenase [Erwinia sp. TH79]
MKLDNKIVLVTGVSSGIGAATASLLRAHGAHVIGVDLKAPHMTLDGFVQGDLSSAENIDRLLPQLPARIDSLCNIAGVPGTANPQLLAQVNYLGLRHLSQALLPRITAGGSIVNIASILGAEWPLRLEQHKALARIEGFAAAQAWLAEHPVPDETCYQYFKEALIVWNYLQAQPWFLEHSVRMNSVAPGPVFTPILGDFVSMLGEARTQADAHRMKRPGYADEVAAVIAFLCADESRWINGVNLAVDGGLASTYI